MSFFTSLFSSLGIVSLGAFCLFGIVFLLIAGIVVGAVVWGLKKGKARLVTGERNFDDFGR